MVKKRILSKAASSVSSPTLPRLPSPIIYDAWLKSIFKSQSSVFGTTTKEQIDNHFEEFLRQSDKVSDTELRRLAGEAKTKKSNEIFEYFRARVSDSVQSDLALLVKATALKTPELHSGPEAEGFGEQWLRQTYAGFAVKTEELNPTETFDRQFMDAAFRVAMERLVRSCQTKGGSGPRTPYGMLTRCLGKESEAYWRDR